MKYFESLAGAHKYAENASRKYEDERYVVRILTNYYVTDSPNVDDGEEIVAHYKNGTKIK